MYGTNFYHNSIRKYTTMIGSLFNNIAIRRFDSSGNVVQTIEIPIAYAPKEEYIRMIREENALGEPNTGAGVQVILPRMSFTLSGYNYAPDRMQSVMHQLKYSSDENGVQTQYMPVAYDFNYDLEIYAKHTDDGLQIVEQILPYFNPTVNWPVTDLPEMDGEITHDIPIEMTGNSFEIDYQGAVDDEDRLMIWTMNLTLRGYLFRPSDAAGLIKKAIVNYHDLNDFNKPLEDQFTQIRYTAEVVPEEANPSDPHEIVETFEDFTTN